MILLFEEYQYANADDIALVKRCVSQAYLTETANGVKVGCVGYFYCTNPKVNDVVFVLPKVFIKEDGTAGQTHQNRNKLIQSAEKTRGRRF